MTNPPVSLVVMLDSGLTYGLQKLLRFVIASLLPILGVIGLIITYKSCFEHGRGILELSRFEVIAFILFIALERRFTYYCTLFGYSFWQGLIRLLSVLGGAAVIVGVGALLHGHFNFRIEPILHQPLWLGTYLLIVYLCAPAAFLDYRAKDRVREDAIEPSLNAADTEPKS